MEYILISAWLNTIIYRVVYLTLTAAFYFLADFGYEQRCNHARTASNKEGFYTVINNSVRLASTEESILWDNSSSFSQSVAEDLPEEVDEISEQVAKIVKSVENFNWAWQFKVNDAEEW